MIQWEEIELGKLFEVKHGWAFKGEFFSSTGELIVVTPGNFYEQGGFRIQAGKEKFYLGNYPKEYLLSENDVIIAMTEQGPGLLGSPGLVPEDAKFLHNQRIGLISKIDSQKAYYKFLYYLFFTSRVRDKIFGSATGTKVKHTAPKRIHEIKVNLPDLLTQRRIASILSAYDNLIENNLKRIKLLEELAQRTYEEWFVKFRVNGEALEINEKTGLPKGWEEKTLNDVCSRIQAGGTPSRTNSSFWKNGTIRWFKTKELQDSWLIDSEERIAVDALKKSSAKMFPANTILMAIYASPTLGRLGIVHEEGSCNQAAIGFICKEHVVSWQWLYFKLFQLRDRFNAIARGAGQQNISGELVKNQSFILPPFECVKRFTEVVRPFFSQSLILQKQNLRLKESRNILLPRLMNGTINVENIRDEDLLSIAAEPSPAYK